jgi:hypothetical protein
MSGSSQAKVYGNNRNTSTVAKKMGSYKGSGKKMGSYTGAVKRLGVYTGVGGGSKNNSVGEIYPRY